MTDTRANLTEYTSCRGCAWGFEGSGRAGGGKRHLLRRVREGLPVAEGVREADGHSSATACGCHDAAHLWLPYGDRPRPYRDCVSHAGNCCSR